MKFIFSWPRVSISKTSHFVKCDTSIYKDKLYNQLPGNRNLVSQPCLCLPENTEKKQIQIQKSNKNSGKQKNTSVLRYIKYLSLHKSIVYRVYRYIEKLYHVI